MQLLCNSWITFKKKCLKNFVWFCDINVNCYKLLCSKEKDHFPSKKFSFLSQPSSAIGHHNFFYKFIGDLSSLPLNFANISYGFLNILQIQPKQTVRGMTYVCTERIFDSRLLMHNKISLEKLFLKFVVYIFTLLLAPFASKLVNYWRHSESLNIRKNSKIDDIFLRRQLIVDFQTYFKDSQCLE